MKHKQIKLFILGASTHGNFLSLEQIRILSEHFKNHPNVHFMEYPKFVVDDPDPDSEKSLSVRMYEAIEKNILEADLLVAIAAFGGSGLGMEIGIGNACNRKTLVCFNGSKQDRSHMILGSVVRNPNMKTIEYFSVDDLVKQIIEQVEEMLK